MVQHIAVGVDDSEAAAAALRWADGLATLAKGSVTAVHAWQEPFVSTYQGVAPSADELIDKARSVISNARKSADVTGNIDSVVVQGSPGPTLVEHARRADLVAVGRGVAGLRPRNERLGEVLFGSTARYVIRHCDVPVAVIPEGAAWSDDPRVLVGIDGSPASIDALRWAVEHFPNGDLHAVQGVEHSDADVELVDLTVDAYRKELDRLVRDVAPSGEGRRQPRTHIAFGAVAQVLVDQSLHAEVVVIGAPPTAPGQERLIGSVSNHAVSYSPVPVIVVPQPASTAASVLLPQSTTAIAKWAGNSVPPKEQI